MNEQKSWSIQTKFFWGIFGTVRAVMLKLDTQDLFEEHVLEHGPLVCALIPIFVSGELCGDTIVARVPQ